MCRWARTIDKAIRIINPNTIQISRNTLPRVISAVKPLAGLTVRFPSGAECDVIPGQ
jgi:hypothetical protein